jgi:hypothetical protein
MIGPSGPRVPADEAQCRRRSPEALHRSFRSPGMPAAAPIWSGRQLVTKTRTLLTQWYALAELRG